MKSIAILLVLCAAITIVETFILVLLELRIKYYKRQLEKEVQRGITITRSIAHRRFERTFGKYRQN